MIYRELGKTGMNLSEIGLGCEGFIGKSYEETEQIIKFVIENGINCMDMYSPDPDMQKRVGRAVAPYRKDFYYQAHLCTIWQDGQYEATRDLNEVKSSFEALLKNLCTNYIDIGMIHYVDSVDTWNEIVSSGILQYALELKQQGIIRTIGVSSHNPVAAMKAIESGDIDVLMFSINPCYDLLPADEDCETLWDEKSYDKPLLNLDKQREQLYEECQRRGVGITVMKVFGGGDLLSENSPAGRALTAVQCISYALDRPAVASVMSGVHSLEQLKDTLKYETASDSEKDYAQVFATFPKISWKGHCMYCGHCAPCPMGIEVATVTKFLNLCKAQGIVPETVREHYAGLSSHAGDCIECGACESRCPFEVKVIDNMKTATEIFGR